MIHTNNIIYFINLNLRFFERCGNFEAQAAEIGVWPKKYGRNLVPEMDLAASGAVFSAYLLLIFCLSSALSIFNSGGGSKWSKMGTGAEENRESRR